MYEQWKAIPDSHYEVSDRGQVRRAVPGPGTYVGRMLRPYIGRKGYRRVALCAAPAKQKWSYVHHLVAEAFVGPRPSPQHAVNHKDFDVGNNCAENLEWVTIAENFHHSDRAGRQVACRGKLNETQVRAILRLLPTLPRNKFSHLGRLYDVSPTTIWSIAANRSWKHIPRI